MNSDFRFALYVFCSRHHTGQWSRLYRLMCRCKVSNLSSHAEKAIASGVNDRNGEWSEAHRYYWELKRKYAPETIR